MEFTISKSPTVSGYYNEDGTKVCHGYYDLEIDGPEIADEWRDYNLSPEVIEEAVMSAEDEISAAVSRIINKRIVKSVVSKTRVIVPASVTLQRWNIHDYAEHCGEVEFDCALALDKIDLADLPEDADDGLNADYLGDDVFAIAQSLGIVDEWDGPFEFYITDSDAYEKYLAARKRG
jgi:hypothetical protein